MIVARGGERGGLGRNEVATLPLPLKGSVLDAVQVPVLAAGGIGTARSLAVGDADTAYGRVFDVGQRLGWPPEYGGRAAPRVFDRWAGREG